MATQLKYLHTSVNQFLHGYCPNVKFSDLIYGNGKETFFQLFITHGNCPFSFCQQHIPSIFQSKFRLI